MRPIIVAGFLFLGCGSGTTNALIPKKGGTIILNNNNFTLMGIPVKSTNVTVGFGDNSGITLPSCTVTTVGACALTACTSPASGLPTNVSAGSVSIAGGTMPVTLQPKADKSYDAFSDGAHALWQGGETLTVSAAGADVPAFSTTVTGPASSTVTMPADPSPDALTVDRTMDLPLAWTGGSQTVRVFVTATTGSILCRFPASDGSGTVPKSLLGMLPAGTGNLLVVGEDQKQLNAGEYVINVSADNPSLSTGPSGIFGPTVQFK